jgi:hypothetical protein
MHIACLGLLLYVVAIDRLTAPGALAYTALDRPARACLFSRSTSDDLETDTLFGVTSNKSQRA